MTSSRQTLRSSGTLETAPSPFVLISVAAAGIAAAVCSVWLAFTSDHVDEPGIQGALMAWMVLGYVVAGVIAWWRRPGRFAKLMVLAGFAIFLSSLSWSNSSVLFTIGIMFDLGSAVVFVHVFLTFPSGRATSTAERFLLAVGYATAFGLQLVGSMLGGFGSDDVLTVFSEPGAARDLLHVQLVVVSAVALASIGVLVQRRVAGRRPLRRSLSLLVDSFALVLVMIAFLFLSAAFGLDEGNSTFEAIRRATFVAIGLAPVVFLVGLLQARLARANVGDLVLELQGTPAPQDLRDALAHALRDPSLDLAYWLPDFECYADLEGHEVQLSEHAGRAVTRIEREGAPLAALVHDPSLGEEPELLDAVAAAAGIALENARLQADLRARVDELAESRARVIDAEQKERQRLERNLHDGAQQRLVAVSMELGRLEATLADNSEAKVQLDAARQQVAVSLEELRDVARGIHPAVVSAHGLAIALEDLAAHGPVPVDLQVEFDGRLPETVEVAAYYVVCESLANVGKHAQATWATVLLRREPDTIVVEITDNGIGGADTERGSGLRGLADRVESLGGRLRIWAPPGGGTRVRAEVPCAS